MILALAAQAAGAEGPAVPAHPARVVSINLCTDQLAMLLAAPGQLVSVTWLAGDPAFSAMADHAGAYLANGGRAEEVFALHPDLVLADIWSPPDTVSMLTRLGIPVVQFPPGESMADIRANIIRMGEVLGTADRAAAMAAAFDARLAGLVRLAPPPGARPRAATWAANAYASGPRSLTGAILDAAGFANVAGELGIEYGGTLPLEALVWAQPDIVITAESAPGASRAEDVLRHPALAGLRVEAGLADADWTCGTPFVLDAVARLAAFRAKPGP
ncbi:MAG: ABC transporter substrate-binding protein [Rhodobacteraceae bacterium]|nr:ABC transporter substrate-binding protein [Paracoccaceae bacterium]